MMRLNLATRDTAPWPGRVNVPRAKSRLPDTDRSIYSHYIDGWRRKTGSQAKEEPNDYTRPADWNSLVRRSTQFTTLAPAISFNETALTQFSHFRYVISFRDGSRIVLLSSISAAFVNPRLRNTSESREYIVTDAMGPTLCIPPFLCLDPLTSDLLHIIFFSSFSLPRLDSPASLFHLSPSHPRSALNHCG